MTPTVASSDSSQTLALAFDCHRAGRLDEAAALYRKALPLIPLSEKNISLRAAIYNNLGAVLRSLADREGAIESFTQAIALLRDYPEAHLNLGVVLMEQQEYGRAVDSFARTLELRPACPEGYNNMGAALRKLHDYVGAERAYKQALALRPTYLEAQLNLALVYQDQEEFEQAKALLNSIVSEHPDCAEAYLNLGTVLHQLQQFEHAAAAFEKVSELKPECAETYINLSSLLKDQQQLEPALVTARLAIQLKPSSPEAHLNLGTVYHDMGSLPKAIESYQMAISLKPDYVEALSELGSVLALTGNHEGLSYLEQALFLRPDYAPGHWNLASASLRFGDYARGWAEHEWRWKWKMFSSPQRKLPQPQWFGQSLEGKSILLHAEQGLGDTLQFLRYVPMVAERGGEIFLEVQEPLRRLLKNFPGVEQIIVRGEGLPETEYHCPLMSLPLVFGTTVDTIPAKVPYLPIPVDPKQRKVAKLRVGLSWAGNPAFRGDHLRSLSFQQLLPLADVPGVEFVCLQKGPAAERIAEIAPEFPIEHWNHTDFAATAEAVAGLDLVISTDTSVAHLAGAMGKPLWLLLGHIADWRWMLNREDSPWYPTARLFRQHELGQWEEVIGGVKNELSKLARKSLLSPTLWNSGF